MFGALLGFPKPALAQGDGMIIIEGVILRIHQRADARNLNET